MVEQFRDIAPPLFLSITMGGIIYTLSWLSLPESATLVLQILCGAIIYVGRILYIFKLESFMYLREMIMNKAANKNKSTTSKGEGREIK